MRAEGTRPLSTAEIAELRMTPECYLFAPLMVRPTAERVGLLVLEFEDARAAVRLDDFRRVMRLRHDEWVQALSALGSAIATTPAEPGAGVSSTAAGAGGGTVSAMAATTSTTDVS